jgi:hypothetical protein
LSQHDIIITVIAAVNSSSSSSRGSTEGKPQWQNSAEQNKT